MLWTVVRVEWRSMVRERSVWALVAAFALLLVYATVGAGLLVGADRRAQDTELREEAQRMAALRGEVMAIAGGAAVRHAADPRNPHLVGRELGRRVAALPPGALAPVSVGQRDVLPREVQVTTQALLAEADEGEGGSPARRAAGPFDPAFVLVFLLPLLIIALAYDLCAGERERGTLGLVLSQPVSLSTFVFGKAVQRGLLTLLVVLVLGLLVPALSGARLSGEGAATRVLLYVALLVAYVAFWFAAAIAVNAWGRSSAGNALSLVGIWLALTMVVPGLTSVAVDALQPMPSRVELVNLARAATSEAESQVSAIEGDHGAAVGAGDNAARRAVEVQRDLERRVQPVLAGFRGQLAEQQRLVDRLRFLSPAILLHEGLNDVAGSGVARHQHFSAQVDGFHASYRDFLFERVQRGAQLSPSDYDAMPRFEYREEPAGAVARRVGIGVLGLLLPAALLAAVALAGLRRPSVLAS